MTYNDIVSNICQIFAVPRMVDFSGVSLVEGDKGPSTESIDQDSFGSRWIYRSDQWMLLDVPIFLWGHGKLGKVQRNRFLGDLRF